MKFVEGISFFLLLILCAITSASDLREGLIRNKVLIRFLLAACVLDVLYYGIMAGDLILQFAVNMLALIIIALALFYTHSFAGGDCKLVIAMGLLFPANYYLMYGGSTVTLFFTIGIAILFGYLYLLCIATWNLIRRKTKITFSYVWNYLRSFGLSFLSVMVYIGFMNLMVAIACNFISINEWLLRAIYITVTWVIGRLEVMRKWYVIIPVIALDAVMSFVMGILPFSVNPENYILVAILLICQMTIKTNVYEEMDIGNLKKGMILSFGTSLLMQNSNIKGMPGLSREDLRSRLTLEEIDSIKRWGKSREISSVMIVKKIPFAIFLSLGFLSYFLIGVYVG